METIAFYRETIIKTYGFLEKTGLCLLTVEFPYTQLSDWGDDCLDLPSRLGVSLLLLIARPVSENTLRLQLLLDKTQAEMMQENTFQAFPAELQGRWGIKQPVELIYFHGPHFGDRYGIASAALTALTSNEIPILAVACTGSSVYLIVPEGKAFPAREALGQAFMTPERDQRE